MDKVAHIEDVKGGSRKMLAEDNFAKILEEKGSVTSTEG